MFEIPRLKTPPTTPAEAIERLEANWKYFGANYALLFFGFVYLVLGYALFCFSLLLSWIRYFYPSLLVCVALVLGLQFAESNVLKGKTFAVAGVTIKHYMIEIAVKIGKLLCYFWGSVAVKWESVLHTQPHILAHLPTYSPPTHKQQHKHPHSHLKNNHVCVSLSACYFFFVCFSLCPSTYDWKSCE